MTREITNAVFMFVVVAILAFLLLAMLSGCQYTAHVAARPVIQGTPVYFGMEIDQ